ncbi:MAG: CotH kinase family protein [Spirochaetes bacterium]|nr:CotH kinase family protein [Spirochaetota bacterium]MBN2772434.1 CotH kinase family protein [Spirochaetota bacterium]
MIRTACKKLPISRIAFFIFSIVLFLLLLVLSLNRGGTVIFRDPGLDAAVRAHLGTIEEGISLGQLNRITSLDASSYQIKDLSGIENLQRLEVLNLENNSVTDITPLAKIESLRELNLRNNGILSLKDIGFSSITDLPIIKLSLRHNVVRSEGAEPERLEDISLLSRMTALRELELRDNHISDLSPLANLKDLQYLDLRQNKISDIVPLSALINIKHLNLRENHIKSLAPLKNLVKLEYLNLHSNKDARDFESLERLTAMRELIMRDVPLANGVGYLSGMKNLYRINLRGSSIDKPDILVNLMEEGALQDNHAQDILANVDIRDNPLFDRPSAGLEKLKIFWKNIDYRRPKQIESAGVTIPVFSHKAGFYTDGFDLSLNAKSGDRIYYTLDGELPEPDEPGTFLYSAPLRIKDRTGEDNSLSLIHTSYPDRESEPLIGKVFKGTVVRALIKKKNGVTGPVVTNSYFVSGDIFKRYGTPVISISAAKDDLFGYDKGILVPGKIYHENEKYWKALNPGAYHHTRPANFVQRGNIRLNVGGLTVERYPGGKVAFKIPQHGIGLDFSYFRAPVPQVVIRGTKNYDGFHYLDRSSTQNMLVFRGRYLPEVLPAGAVVECIWEREVNLEFFEADGNIAFTQKMGVRVHGESSRSHFQKTLRFYARSEYDDQNYIDYRLFPEYEQNRYKRFLLRQTTERTGLTDIIAQKIMININPDMDIQRYRPAAVFINGEFWGWYNIRDRYDDWYLATKYNVSRDDITAIEGYGNLLYGKPGEQKKFLMLDSYIRKTDLSNNDNYKHLKSLMDVDNYMTYMAVGIYLNYQDWGTDKHQLVWRIRKPVKDGPVQLDGRWRWLPIDLDGTILRENNPSLNHLKDTIEDRYSDAFGLFLPYRYHLHFLLQNEEFKNRFINLMADSMNTVLSPEGAHEIVQEVVLSQNRRLVLENEKRWEGVKNLNSWDRQIKKTYAFFKQRPVFMRRHIMDYFGIDGTYSLDIIADSSRGYVRVNSIDIRKGTPGVGDAANWNGIYFKGVPVSIEAVPARGYRFAKWRDMPGDKKITVSPESDIVIMPVFEKI